VVAWYNPYWPATSTTSSSNLILYTTGTATSTATNTVCNPYMYWTTPSIYAADLYTAQMLQQQQMSMLQQQQMSVQQASQHLLRQAQAAQEQHQLWLHPC
jgi:hypothetical protein